ncbi:MAG: 4-alpha-glucanotransferase [Bacteroidales bacterium]
MTIHFNLEYHTRWGQEIFLTGSLPALGSDDIQKAIPLHYDEKGHWLATIHVPENENFSYRYLIREKDKNDLPEKGITHHAPKSTLTEIYLYDQWQNIPEEMPFFSSAFASCILSRKENPVQEVIAPDTLIIRCFASTLLPDQIPALCGECATTGNWNPENALKMEYSGNCEWSITFPLKGFNTPCNYKFVVLDKQNNSLIYWESGPNRTIPPLQLSPNASVIISGLYINNPQKRWKGAGVAIPVFSLRSENGFGIGEFPDLIPLIDWAVSTGQKIIQILPVNDTTMTHTWHDSYPYNANSIFALHPAYINPENAGILQDSTKMEAYYHEKEKLNQLPDIDYERVTKGKWDYLRHLFDETGVATLNSHGFRQFFINNREWLIPYAAFSYLREKYDTPDFNWWEEYNRFDPIAIGHLSDPESETYMDLAFYYFVQFQADRQLKAVSDYARKKGVVLKGDIPIGISRTSVDAWMNPDLFHLNSQAGAPPDDFSRAGQNWGFPTYNWEVMKENHFDWWKKRFQKMSDYFDAYRIDHILGFFRIWEIPVKATQGILGHFNPALPYSADEIYHFGFNFNPERDTRPFIREDLIRNLFGDDSEEVKEEYLDPNDNQGYSLKKEFDTQLEIVNYFNGQTDEKSGRIRDGLLHLATEILFIPEYKDGMRTGKYHPRIAAQNTNSYASLDWDQKNAYDRLYNHFFYERHNEFWADKAYEKLPPLLAATQMLACGEDLGMIPACVEEVMEDLRILSLEIQRMPKKEGVTFDTPATYPYLSVCTTSTHDMSTLREWWTENPALSQQYYNQILNREGYKPADCTSDICTQIIDQHLASPAMFTILPWQDWLSMDEKLRRKNAKEERINIPSVARHYWRYRMHIPLEKLLEEYDFNKKIKDMIVSNNR